MKEIVLPVDNQEALAYVNATARKALRKSDLACSQSVTGLFVQSSFIKYFFS